MPHCAQVQEEERHKNEANLMTLVSDSISAMVFFAMFVRDTAGRTALFNTIGRLFEGLSDIAKAVLIILVADTLLGYHSEEGEWQHCNCGAGQGRRLAVIWRQ